LMLKIGVFDPLFEFLVIGFIAFFPNEF